MLKIENLTKHFGGIKAVQNFDMQVSEQEIVGIIGPNGAGKSTILNLISGVTKTDTGHVYFENKEITRLNQYQISRMGLARTFQNIRLFKGLSCIENIKVARDCRISYNLIEALLSFPKALKTEKNMEKESLKFLKLVGLEKHNDIKPGNLPYGLQRKLEIARALFTQPKILLLDEPAAGLNTAEVIDLVRLINQIFHEFKISIVLIEHKMEVINELCDVVYVLNFGNTIAKGTYNEIQSNKDVLEAYLGGGDNA